MARERAAQQQRDTLQMSRGGTPADEDRLVLVLAKDGVS